MTKRNRKYEVSLKVQERYRFAVAHTEGHHPTWSSLFMFFGALPEEAEAKIRSEIRSAILRYLSDKQDAEPSLIIRPYELKLALRNVKKLSLKLGKLFQSDPRVEDVMLRAVYPGIDKKTLILSPTNARRFTMICIDMEKAATIAIENIPENASYVSSHRRDAALDALYSALMKIWDRYAPVTRHFYGASEAEIDRSSDLIRFVLSCNRLIDVSTTANALAKRLMRLSETTPVQDRAPGVPSRKKAKLRRGAERSSTGHVVRKKRR